MGERGKILPVLMAGGSGTRLWPLSRELYPKQFHRLLDDRTLLQSTALRARKLAGALPPLVICGEQHRFVVAEQLRQCGIEDARIVLEPEGRNTAPAAAVASLVGLRTHGPDTLIFLMAADQALRDVEQFIVRAQKGVDIASNGMIVTFGIVPTRPETGFGYLKAGRQLDDGCYEVAQFVEKPAAETAAAFLKQGGYFWNGGMFLFRADGFLHELERLEPAMFAGAREAVDKGVQDLHFLRLDAAAFKQCRNESIDYAVMEKTQAIALVSLDAGWDDVGSWTYLAALPSDAAGNVTKGDVLYEGARNNLVYATNRLVSLVGVEDHIVVETSDAVLVARRDMAQDVKKIVQQLKARQRSEAESPPRMYRPWGWYETLIVSERFQVKRILVQPGHKLSLQMHHHRAEHWIVVKGTARVTCEDNVFLLSEDQSTYIPLGHRHRLDNPGKVPLELIEVQSGAYVGEDDIVRIEDDYGR